MSDLTFNIHRARRRARRRVVLVRVMLIATLGVLAASFVGLGYLVLGEVSWMADVPEILIWFIAFPITLADRAFTLERKALSSCTHVARMLNAREVSTHRLSEAELALRNVAEELAIAAGTPVPRLYILPDQPGVNAVAVGPDTARGGVFVTSSAVQELERDALQGIVAHELAHLLTGDATGHAYTAGATAALRSTLAPIRLVVRAVGMVMPGLGGALCDALSSRSRQTLARWALALFPIALGTLYALATTSATLGISGDVFRALGVLLVGTTALGGVGWFFATEMDLTVSRETDFGADALAVEMTRDPDGLADALRAVRDRPTHGLVRSPAVSKLRPFFFAPAQPRPSSNPVWPAAGSDLLESRLRALKAQDPDRRWRAPAHPRSLGVDHVARAASDPIGDASHLLDALPYTLRDGAHDPSLVEALVYALLTSDQPERSHIQLDAAPFADFASARDYHRALARQPAGGRLALLSIALPTLRRLGSSARRRLLEHAPRVAAADGRMTVRETAICEVLHHALAPTPRRRRPTATQISAAGSVLLSALALSGDPTQDGIRRAFHAGHAVLRDKLPAAPPRLARPDQERLRTAFGLLSAASDTQKDVVLDAARATLWTDGRVLDGEADLIRAVALVLHRPSLLPFETAERAAAPTVLPPAFA